jgi:hypothetical protein
MNTRPKIRKGEKIDSFHNFVNLKEKSVFLYQRKLDQKNTSKV